MLEQKRVLEPSLCVSNTAYNWCVWLERKHKVCPKFMELCKYVAPAKQEDVPGGSTCQVAV